MFYFTFLFFLLIPFYFFSQTSVSGKEIGKVKIGIFHNVEKNRLEVVVTRFDEVDRNELGEDPPSTYIRICLLPDENTKV